jgi:hypothetical protein
MSSVYEQNQALAQKKKEELVKSNIAMQKFKDRASGAKLVSIKNANVEFIPGVGYVKPKEPSPPNTTTVTKIISVSTPREQPQDQFMLAIAKDPSLAQEPEIIAALKQTPQERQARWQRANILIAIGSPFAIAAVAPASLVSLPSVLIGSASSVGISEGLKLLTTGKHLTIEETAQTSFTGGLTTATLNVFIGKVITPRVESYLAKSYRGAVEAGKLWSPSRGEKVLSALTGAKFPNLAPQIVSMPQNVGLEEFEFALSPRSSALFTPLPSAPRFAPQIVSFPYKEVLIESGKAVPIISKPLMEAQDVAWELQLTPKSSGVMLWKLTIEEQEKHFVHLISRQGYTTIGPLIYEKPFSSGFLSAPTGALITTQLTKSYGKKMPFYPQILESPKQLTRAIPYTPEIMGSMGKASSLIGFGFPFLTPTKTRQRAKPVISPITTPHLFPSLASRSEPSEIVVPTAMLKTPTKSKQSQTMIPTLIIGTPEPNAPRVPSPTTEISIFPTPNIPKLKFPTITAPPSFPRGGSDSATRSLDKLTGFWYPRKHPVKSWDKMLGTFGFKVKSAKLKRLGKMEVPQIHRVVTGRKQRRKHKR